MELGQSVLFFFFFLGSAKLANSNVCLESRIPSEMQSRCSVERCADELNLFICLLGNLWLDFPAFPKARKEEKREGRRGKREEGRGMLPFT